MITPRSAHGFEEDSRLKRYNLQRCSQSVVSSSSPAPVFRRSRLRSPCLKLSSSPSGIASSSSTTPPVLSSAVAPVAPEVVGEENDGNGAEVLPANCPNENADGVAAGVTPKVGNEGKEGTDAAEDVTGGELNENEVENPDFEAD